MEEESPAKRKAPFQRGPPSKMAKTSANGTPGGGGGMTFAQKMMAKMGYSGGGLGKQGEGMLKPIEVQLRPQGVGLGAVKEMTKQAKEEAKRQAEKRGDEYEDLSEEERKKRQQRQKPGPGRSTPTSGISTPGGNLQRPKTKYKTAADFEAAAEGLKVPNVLKNIIDARAEPRILTSTSGLLTPTSFQRAETEAEKVANRARRDLEGFVAAWNKNENQKLYNEQSSKTAEKNLEEIDHRLEVETVLVQAVEAIESLDLAKPCLAIQASEKWESATAQLEDLQQKYADDMDRFGVPEIAVAAIAPLFKQEMIDWDPLTNPTHLVGYLARISRILLFRHDHEQHNSYDEFDPRGLHRQTTPYESLIQTMWLPKVRTAVTNQWDPHSPNTLVVLVETWKPLLPDFVYSHLMEGLIVKKLSAAVKAWNPRKALKRKHADDLLHIWLFPWLQHLDSHHLDPKASDGLLAEVRRKLRGALDSWDVGKGVMPGLEAWRDILGSTLTDALISHVLPRLSSFMAFEFEVDPGDQETYLPVLKSVLAWKDLLPPKALVRLLQHEFFRKWLHTMHQWLTHPGADFAEVGRWFAWWRSYFPPEINALPDIQAEWQRGSDLMNLAVALGDRVATDLPAPAAGPPLPLRDLQSSSGVSTPGTKGAAAAARTPAPPHPADGKPHEEPSFKELLERFCDAHSLLLIPMREAHPTTGKPLFRITASASGKGGVVGYLEDGNLFARRKGDKSAYDILTVGRELVDRAEER